MVQEEVGNLSLERGLETESHWRCGAESLVGGWCLGVIGGLGGQVEWVGPSGQTLRRDSKKV